MTPDAWSDRTLEAQEAQTQQQGENAPLASEPRNAVAPTWPPGAPNYNREADAAAAREIYNRHVASWRADRAAGIRRPSTPAQREAFLRELERWHDQPGASVSASTTCPDAPGQLQRKNP